ncbi:2-keto-4-pentenoate hydratase [Caenimonas sp. SL110]|uniref:2-keto-4-pentenoate hydratase n=1 Tax=Caenimonas sp. SL110 TaxID=1450524 RepID=UPI00069EDD12|nr:fumarylacetoacetate hydrolase family protein [Caenimonas sp. SL110]
MTQTLFDASAAAERFLAARKGSTALQSGDVLPFDKAGAYAVQDGVVRSLGAIGGWKVGAKGPEVEPACAPLPASGLFASGAKFIGAPWVLRGVEVEVAVRLGKDLPARGVAPGADQIRDAIEAVLPVIEVVETRLADYRASSPLAQLADLQSHGALVLGADASVDTAALDLRSVEAYLAFDGQPVATTRGGNPAADIWRLIGWLALHCEQRGMPLRAGQVITTGSCTGMLFAPQGARVQGRLTGIGDIELQF